VIRTRWSSDDPADQLTVDNPATGAPLAIIQGASAQEVDQAIQAAYDAHLT
jgi:acyl-CoA reductase-like NAD-dependent aldehyde dehydrogenase